MSDDEAVVINIDDTPKGKKKTRSHESGSVSSDEIVTVLSSPEITARRHNSNSKTSNDTSNGDTDSSRFVQSNHSSSASATDNDCVLVYTGADNSRETSTGKQQLVRPSRKRRQVVSIIDNTNTKQVPVSDKKRRATFKCMVCLDRPTNSVLVRPCGHVFCEECILTSMHAAKKCPVCRQTISKKNISSFQFSVRKRTSTTT